MPRVAGQVDERKSQAILDAASTLFAEQGPAASMGEIARRAGVSKQTLYNRYASKVEIGRALAARRSDLITAPLRSGGEPEAVLTALARSLLHKVCTPDHGSLRGVMMMSGQLPELARAIYEAGPGESLRRLAAWLEAQDRAGALSVPQPLDAAEVFTGMAIGHGHLRHALDLPNPPVDIDKKAKEVARRFVAAYARAQ
jgi:TetR/AcrR family transcriptional repressor of mexJK operon